MSCGCNASACSGNTLVLKADYWPIYLQALSATGLSFSAFQTSGTRTLAKLPGSSYFAELKVQNFVAYNGLQREL